MVETSKLIHDVPTSPWRTYNIILSICCIVISLMFGIGNVMYSPDSHKDLAKLCQREPNYCTLQTYVHYLKWIPFFASLLLFLACRYNSTTLIHCCTGLIITDLVLSVKYYNVIK